MENKYIEEKIELKKINGLNAFYYKVLYPEQNIKELPMIKKWIFSQKIKNGILIYCKKCNLFFYLENKNNKIIKPKCCDDYDYGQICNYCGQLYFDNSNCCIKNAINTTKKFLFDDINDYKRDIINIFKYFPFTFFIYIIFSITSGFFLERRKTVKNDIFSNYYSENNSGINVYIFSIVVSSILFSIIFFIPHIILLSIYLIIMLIKINKE